MLGDNLRIRITITDEDGNNYEGTADLTKTDAKTKSKEKRNALPTNVTGPASVIHRLYLDEFFKEEKNRVDVIEKMGNMGFNLAPNAISMALDRADYLIRRGTKGNYTFVQKYPPG